VCGGVYDVITGNKFHQNRSRCFRATGVRKLGSPIDLACRPYNSSALPCWLWSPKGAEPSQYRVNRRSRNVWLPSKWLCFRRWWHVWNKNSLASLSGCSQVTAVDHTWILKEFYFTRRYVIKCFTAIFQRMGGAICWSPLKRAGQTWRKMLLRHCALTADLLKSDRSWIISNDHDDDGKCLACAEYMTVSQLNLCRRGHYRFAWKFDFSLLVIYTVAQKRPTFDLL